MSPRTATAARQAQLAQIHIARKDLERTHGLTEEAYRDLMAAKFAGLRSSAALSPAQRTELLAHFARMGWQAKPSRQSNATAKRPAWGPALKKLWSLWQQLHAAGLVQDRSSKALTAWAKAQTAGADKASGCDRLEWLTGQQLSELTESAKHWLARAAKDAPSFRAVCSGVFTECRDACPFYVRTATGGGGWQDDCAHRENSPHLPTNQTPCDPRICPIFTSDDPDGDEENDLYPHEVHGQWAPQNRVRP